MLKATLLINPVTFTLSLLVMIASTRAAVAQSEGKVATGAPEMQHMRHHGMSKNSDGRRPLFLTQQMAEHQLANMRGHLEAIEAVVAGLAKQDFAAVKSAAQQLASTPTMTQMCQHMGAATLGFTELGLALHKAGDELVAAAEKKDAKIVLRQLEITLKNCTSCHSAYRQEIVSEQELRKLEQKK